MNTLILGPLLRYVDSTSATVWVEVDGPGVVEILGRKSHTFRVEGRDYALVVIEGLEPGSSTEYHVTFNKVKVWPAPNSTLPASVIRTPKHDAPASILLGSCRAAAPHEPPYTFELILDSDGRGIDTLWAHGRRMLTEAPEDWPDLLLLVGDQIYADDSSPRARERIEQRRGDSVDLPPEIVADFEEYCWLYHEAWSASIERWLLSTVPSAMIFDDHDNIDDWNISQSWVGDIRREPWWGEHSIGGLVSYWVYQHLGNLSPATICSEGLLDRLVAIEDSTDILRAWATEVESATPESGGYQFSFDRTFGDVTIIVIDCRMGRVLTDDTRLMIGVEEWRHVCDVAESAAGHLLFATSLPVFIADGLHDLQVWNERVASGVWGRVAARMAEKIRRALDLEDWSAFIASYRSFVDLLVHLQAKDSPPASIVIASGDIHFSYAARVPLPADDLGPAVWQVVSSPIRNALIPPERGVLRATLTSSGRRIGSLLRRASGAPETRPGIDMAVGPFFANNMAEIHYDRENVHLQIEQSSPDDAGEPCLAIVADIPLASSATAIGGSPS